MCTKTTQVTTCPGTQQVAGTKQRLKQQGNATAQWIGSLFHANLYKQT
jgi:hypothetical protein